MLIYSVTKDQFDSDVKEGVLADKIKALFFERGFKHENEREYMSWKNSLEYMQRVLDDPRFSDKIQIAVEYQIPQTAKRVDFIIAGENDDEQPNAIIVELKQWTSSRSTPRKCIVRAYTGGEDRFLPHPSYQAYSYAKAIENYNSSVEECAVSLHPCSYLHNYEKGQNTGVEDAFYSEIVAESPMFLKTDEDKFQDFIAKYVTRPSKKNIMHEIDNGRIRPSRALQDALCSMLKGNEEFVLLDEQKVVFEAIKSAVVYSLEKNKKVTIIVEGGPGTGKSVVAVQLLAELIRQNYSAHYVTKNKAPRDVYKEKLNHDNDFKKPDIKGLFKNSGAYVYAKSNDVDCIIVDESHRLVRSFGYYSGGENQIKEIINAAKVSVFFIDESQIVSARDIGRISEIKRWAAHFNCFICHDPSTILHSQYRCNGSDSYISFLDNLLGINSSEVRCLEMDYDIRVFDDPCDMRDALSEKNKINNKARMLAGYCYEWVTRENNRTDVYDIDLPSGFHAKWNFDDSEKIWATDQDSFEQVGCIHTSQGLEFDYVGVIIGKDLRFENGRIITDASQHPASDNSFKYDDGSICSASLADTIIRNTYRTLLTRGQKGCYIYCEDNALSGYISLLINKLTTHHIGH